MKFRCPQCGQKLEGDKSFAGSEIDCPKCNFGFVIPNLQDEDPTVHPPGTPVKAADHGPKKNYTFHGQIARGGMGKIVSATDDRLERSVVVKQLPDPVEDPAKVNQLIREAQITARLSHPGIVPIHELGRDAQGRIYYTMKHIRGEPLDKVLDKLREGDPDMIEKCPFQRLLLIFIRVCDAIGYANAMGIVHRDIKPDNIMLAPYGEYLVIDWGIAKDLNKRSPEDEALIASAYRYTPEKGEFGATLHGAVFGSPSYMSPEQAKGDIDAIDARTDVFGLGALLFEMLTLSPPYEGYDPEEVVKLAAERKIRRISAIRRERPDPLNPWPHIKGPDLPKSVLAVALKAMQMDPDDRYQTAEELRSDIDSYLSGRTTEAENAGFVKIVRLALQRNKGIATALAWGLSLAGAAVFVTASLNHKETRKAKLARTEAESYIIQANEAKAQRHRTRLEVAPGYVEIARQLANRGEVDDALVVATLAAEFDPDLVEATALVKALGIYTAVNKGEAPTNPAVVGNRPSLHYLLHHPEELKTEPGIRISEQTYTRLEQAYSEVGLSRFSGQLTAEQGGRVDLCRNELKEAWKDCDLDWELSLAPELSSLCLPWELQNCYSDYSNWAFQIDRTYPGQVLHLAIRQGSIVPDLSILANLSIESVFFGEGTEMTKEQIGTLANCRSLKVFSSLSNSFRDLTFLKGLPLVSLQIYNDTPELALSPLEGCDTLRVLATGPETKVTSLASLPSGKLQVFSGGASDDYSALAGMPLQLLEIRKGNAGVNLDPLVHLPVQSLIAEGIDLTKNWDTIASWPLRFLSVDSDINVDISTLGLPASLLTELHVKNGHWTGNADRVFPVLEQLVDRTGHNFECFTQIDSVETIRLEGDGASVCYLSALETVPPTIDLQISPQMPIQVLPEHLALNIVKNDWTAASIGFAKMVKKLQRRLALIPASAGTIQLGNVISNQEDPDEIFISRKYAFQGNLYQAVFCGLTKEEAEKFARNAGAALAFIKNKNEQDFLLKIALAHPEYEAFWIGGRAPSLQPGNKIPPLEAPVVPAAPKGKTSLPRSFLCPFIIEWKESS